MLNMLGETKRLINESVSYRRYIHENAELAGREFDTINYICSQLERMGVEYVNIPDGGVLAIINGSNDGKTILLRADCDALPIQESSKNGGGKEKYSISTRDGAAHMCGHDAHTAMLLTAVSVLNKHRDEIKGKVVALFERGEEGGKCIYYVLKYIHETNFHIDVCWGLHVDVSRPTGIVSTGPGPRSAGNVAFEVQLTGKGGHGSRPDMSVNPIDCFVAIINAIKEIRMKMISPIEPLTYNIGLVDGGSKRNIIPEKLFFAGTCRFYNPDIGRKFKERVREVVTTLALVYRCEAKFTALYGPSLPLINNEEMARTSKEAIIKYLGKEVYMPFDAPGMGSESFSFLAAYYPSAMGNVGCRNEEKGITANAHDPHFEVDEDCLPYGAATYVAVALEYLNEGIEIPFTPFDGNADDLMVYIDRPVPPRYDILKTNHRKGV